MKKNRKQWMKYTAVVLSFLIMAGFFMSGTKTQVNATEAEGSVSGGNVETEEPVMTMADSWSVTVNYVSDGVTIDSRSAQGTPSSGATIQIPSDINVTKDNWIFEGWLYEDKLYQSGSSILVEYNASVTEINLVAQWKETVTISYDFDGGTMETLPDGYTKTESGASTTIIKGENESEFSFILLDSPQKTGHTFNNWNEGNAGSTITRKWSDYVGKTIVIKASWTEHTNVNLIFVDRGETVHQYKVYYTGQETDTGFTVTFPETQNSGYSLSGWLCSKDNKPYTTGPTYKWTEFKNVLSSEITFTAQWQWKGDSLQEGTEYYLETGVAYTISEGTWKVNDDGYSYSIGENFFVGTAGNYTFTK